MSSIETEVLDVIRHYLTSVRRSGPENVMALCPFHVKANGQPETTPSFAISLVTGLWMCHSCHEKGNLRTFLRAIGVPARTMDTFYKPLLEAVEAEASRHYKKRGRLLQDNIKEVLEESILGLFENCPLALLEEGFTEETLRHFDVGFDKKHNRITYPIRDILGRLIGISGRTVTDESPRYKVYGHDEYTAWGITPVSTDKSLIVWNIDKVFPQTYFGGVEFTVLVEGFKACMWVWQAGFKNVVALMGSYLSPYQQALIDRMGGTVYLFLDTNEAGTKGAMFAGQKLVLSGRPVRVVQYQEPQPTDLSPQQVKESVLMAVDFMKWGCER